MGTPGTIISYNNTIGADIESCTAYPDENIYVCDTLDFGIVEWDAKSADRHLLSSAPVHIINEGMSFNNTINMWREWGWNGAEPLN